MQTAKTKIGNINNSSYLTARLINQGIIFLYVFFSQETGDAHSIKLETIFRNNLCLLV